MTTPIQRIDALLAAARARVERTDAELLLAQVLGKSRSWLFAHGDDVMDPRDAERFEQQGALVELMPEYRSIELGSFAVYATRKHLPMKTRRLIDFLVEAFRAPIWV